MDSSDASSIGSGRSLRSKGRIEDPDPRGTGIRKSSRKPAAQWNCDEEAALVEFLCVNVGAAGDTLGFKKRTFEEAAAHLKKTFPKYKGGEKTHLVCQSKWQSVSLVAPLCGA